MRRSREAWASGRGKLFMVRLIAVADWGWSSGTSGYDDEDRRVLWDRRDSTLSQDWTLTAEGDWSQLWLDRLL